MMQIILVIILCVTLNPFPTPQVVQTVQLNFEIVATLNLSLCFLIFFRTWLATANGIYVYVNTFRYSPSKFLPSFIYDSISE